MGSWEEAFEVIPDLGDSVTEEFWLEMFKENPDALYNLLSDIYFISDYRKTGTRRKKDGKGTLADLWNLLGES